MWMRGKKDAATATKKKRRIVAIIPQNACVAVHETASDCCLSKRLLHFFNNNYTITQTVLSVVTPLLPWGRYGILPEIYRS
jgi:hypothetical protein